MMKYANPKRRQLAHRQGTDGRRQRLRDGGGLATQEQNRTHLQANSRPYLEHEPQFLSLGRIKM